MYKLQERKSKVIVVAVVVTKKTEMKTLKSDKNWNETTTKNDLKVKLDNKSKRKSQRVACTCGEDIECSQ